MVCDVRYVYIGTFLIYVYDVVDNLRIVFLLISASVLANILVICFGLCAVVR